MKILIVSNDSVLTDRIVFGLQGHCDFIVRRSFAEGLKALQGPVFDCVLIDAELPDSDSIRTTGEIRLFTRVVPTIVVLGDQRAYLDKELYRNEVRRVIRLHDVVRFPAKAWKAVKDCVSHARLNREIRLVSKSIGEALSQFF